VGPGTIVAGLALLLVVRFDDPWTAQRPELSQVFYHVDQDAGRAWRISPEPERSDWTDLALRADGGSVAQRRHWLQGRPVHAAPGPMVMEAPPQITLTRQADGRLRLHAVPPPGARILSLQLRPSVAASAEPWATVTQKLPMRAGGWTRVRWHAEPGGVDILIRPTGPGTLEVRYAATLERWPKGPAPLPPRPADVMAFDASDSTLVTGTRRFAW
jgi:hypothetical protein